MQSFYLPRPRLEWVTQIAPAFAAIPFLSLVDFDVLLGLEHVGMLLAMLGAMLLRPAEYAHGAHSHETVTA